MELDYLLHAPDDHAGALGVGLQPEPPPPWRDFHRTQDLESLQALADARVAQEDLPSTGDADDAAQKLLLAGTAMGGARPKTVLESQDALWVAKLDRTDDRWSASRIEYAMLRLARECGIHAADCRLVQFGHREGLLVRRFDREWTEEGYLRARMLSALTGFLRGKPRPSGQGSSASSSS